MATSKGAVLYLISIHAPPRGATKKSCKSGTTQYTFQFTPLREGRQYLLEATKDAQGISIHAPPRGATNAGRNQAAKCNFNSRPSARGDAHSAAVRCFSAAFQFTPLREGRPARKSNSTRSARFQFTPLREGRRAAAGRRITRLTIFQFTPLREGRPMHGTQGEIARIISIHAPPRGATGRGESRGRRPRISIHAPPRGATARQNVGDCIRVFQFTPLREGRLLWLSDNVCPANFNSRPSARGDDHDEQPPRAATTFQFTPLREGRRNRPKRATARRGFQFTPLREGRHYKAFTQWAFSHFNSRPSARGDRSRLSSVGELKNFNSRPSARGDVHRAVEGAEFNRFQFTPLREGRQQRARLPDGRQLISIHAPPRGATGLHARKGMNTIFQFTPLREGRHEAVEDEKKALEISIHAPPRGATSVRESSALRRTNFNSRPSARGDPSSSAQDAPEYVFQFTPLREGRLHQERIPLPRLYFNSRPSARGDHAPRRHLPDGAISIHAPPRGATVLKNRECSTRQFQFTPLREGRRPG